ncbi:unnamed protein product [Dicrocoelium dendriticum]|nr:unnamed protein product [Dicrocoelium dendriticum]
MQSRVLSRVHLTSATCLFRNPTSSFTHLTTYLMEQTGSDTTECDNLLTQASSLFHSKDFDRCEEVINSLLNLKPNHSKALMNKALLDYVSKHHYTHTDEYMKELKRIASVEGVQLTSDPSSCTQTTCEQSATSEPNGGVSGSLSTVSITMDGPEYSIPQSALALSLKYNYALVLFYQRKYVQAEHILSTCLGLRTCVKSSEKGTSDAVEHLPLAISADLPTINLTPTSDLLLCRRILLLWLESLLHLQQSERVFRLCATWLTVLSSITLTNSLNSINLTAPDRSFSSMAPRYVNSQACTMLQEIHKPIQLFYIRACLLTGRLHAAEDELNHVTGEQDTPDLHGQEDIDVSNCDENGKRLDDDRSPSVTCDSEKHHQLPVDSWSTGRLVHFLQAHLAFLKGNHSEALRRLSDIPPPVQGSPATDQCESALLRNNLGLVLHRAGQYNLSGLQLRRALREVNQTSYDLLPQPVSHQSNGFHHKGSSTKHMLNETSLLHQLFTSLEAAAFSPRSFSTSFGPVRRQHAAPSCVELNYFLL